MSVNGKLNRNKKNLIHLLLIVFLFFFLCNCEPSFQPIKENNNVPLSIYGYLDASADTQWVRITPIRNQIDQIREKPEMHITLQDIESGETTILNDSLFQFQQDFNAVNAWTTMNLNAGRTYTLTAERADGAISHVSVTLPQDFPTPELYDYGDGCRALMRIEGLEGLTDIQSQWEVRILFFNENNRLIFEQEESYLILYRDQATRIAEGAYELSIDTESELSQIRSQIVIPSGGSIDIQVFSRNIFVASGGPEWNPEITTIDDIEYALPEGLSNVENGLGYLVGIVSKTIPYETCFPYLN